MKKLNVFISLLTMIIAGIPVGYAGSSFHSSYTEDSLIIWCSPELIKLVSQLEEEYTGIHTEVKTSVVAVNADRISGKLVPNGGLGFVTKEQLPETGSIAEWKISIGKEIYVFVVNEENPFMERICTAGLTREKLIALLKGETEPVWGSLLGDGQVALPVNVCWFKDISDMTFLSQFSGTEPPAINGYEAPGMDEMKNRIRNDKYVLGFCRLAQILDKENKQVEEGIRLVPIDVNGNSQIDHFENIYNSYSDFSRGVWIGKYPRELCGNIYTISTAGPSDAGQHDFMEWVLTDGQQYLSANGYTELLSGERYRMLQSLNEINVSIVEVNKAPMRAVTIILFLAIILIGGILIFTIIQLIIRPKPELTTEPVKEIAVFNENSVTAPGGLFFDKSHTWAFMEEDGFVKIGIDDFLKHITSPVTKIKMKTTGEKIKKGKVFTSLIQNGKQLDIYAPVSGIIKEYNERLFRDTSLINASPYSEGWICKVEPDNWLMDLRTLLIGEKYRGWLRKEFSRLKDFLASALNPDLLENSQLIMQDGGELRDNLLQCLGPEQWEKFQAGFIDVSM